MSPRARVASLIVAIGALLVMASSALALTSFTTPSRNIGCIGDRSEVRCDIRSSNFTPPKRPAKCDLDWGDAFAVGPTGRGRGVCHGDTALPAPNQKGLKVLKYGTSIRLGKITCTSRKAGLTCRNPGPHGFFLSREKLRLF